MACRATEYNVTVNGGGQMGSLTFPEVVEEITVAATLRSTWDVRVRGPRDSAFRPLNETEATTLIAAVTEEMNR